MSTFTSVVLKVRYVYSCSRATESRCELVGPSLHFTLVSMEKVKLLVLQLHRQPYWSLHPCVICKVGFGKYIRNKILFSHFFDQVSSFICTHLGGVGPLLHLVTNTPKFLFIHHLHIYDVTNIYSVHPLWIVFHVITFVLFFITTSASRLLSLCGRINFLSAL